MKRRDFLSMLGVSTASAVFGSISRSANAQIGFMNSNPMPVGYVAHGSPLLLADKIRGAELAAWGASMPKPKGIVVVTPHYRSKLVQVGHVGPGFGMYNLPDWILKQTPKASYNSPDNTALAKRVTDLLSAWWRLDVSNRIGFDHTTWIPLFHMFPKADIPVVEIAMPFFQENELIVLGHSLRELRNEGVLILASGTMTHNLAAADLEGKTSRAPEWASSFDGWAKKTIEARDVTALRDWRKLAPNAEVAHPDDGGHFRVFMIAAGAALIHGSDPPTFRDARFPTEGFELGNLSKRCVELA